MTEEVVEEGTRLRGRFKMKQNSQLMKNLE